MRTAGLALTLVIGLGAASHAPAVRLAADAPAAQATFRGGIDLITVGVTVADRRGAFVTDLTAADFEILEDGTPQTITSFARGEEGAAAPELHVGLLFDTSESMGADIDLARTAAVRFFNTLRDAREMTLVDFDTEVRIARYSQDNFPRLVERIRGRRPSGETAMYDALGVYLDGAADEGGRTILVIFTDGEDTRSAISFGDTMTLVRASDVTIYSLGLFGGLSNRSSTLAQRSRLTEIAEATGGQAFFPSSMRDVEAAYDRILAQIRAQYTLGYISTNTRKDGAWRKVEIRVRRPDVRGARVQAREGYFAPFAR
jgi:Ca-activated chloride channel family protein